MILVVVTIRLHSGKSPDFEAALARIMPEVRAANPGVLFYHGGRCRDDADTYRVVEAYADEAAMDNHISNPATRETTMMLMPLIADIEVTSHDVVA